MTMTPIIADGQAGKAIGWLEGHRGEPLSVAQIAIGAGVSEATVRRVLRELDRACRLTANRRWPRGYQLTGGRR